MASSHEQLAAEDWAEALNEVLIKAQPAPPRRPEETMPVPPRAAAPPPPEQIDVAVGNQEPSAAVDDSAEPAGSAALDGRPFLAFRKNRGSEPEKEDADGVEEIGRAHV